MATPLKALLFLGGATAAALGAAYVAGVFDPAQQAPAGIAQPTTPPGKPATEVQAAAPPAAEKPAAEGKPAEQQVAAAAPEKPETKAPATGPIAPSFDLLRVEADGSTVIAGKAMPGSTLEALVGSRVIGKTETTPGGDFVIVLDNPLPSGDHQVVLRSTGPGQIVMNSVETAVVSVPATPDGQVLALVEQPGAPSKLITITTTEKPATPPQGGASAAPSELQPAKPAPPAAAPVIAVEAVEIEGRKVFVAGTAPAGAYLRAYANEILLGDTKATPEGRFLIETERDLKVGDYIVRIDQLSPNGDKVIARATVPFKREAGESVAAVAPAKPASPAPQATQQGAAAEAPQSAAVAAVEPAAPAATAPAAPQKPADAPAATADKAAAPADTATQPAEVATAPQLEASASGVIIRRGDTLWRISKRVYGRGTRYSTIYSANRQQIADPNRIWPGQVFRVPEKSEQGESADMDTVQDQATKL